MLKEVRKPKSPIRREHFFALLLLGILYALLTVPPLKPVSPQVQAKNDPLLVRVVLPPHSQALDALSPYGPGFDSELLDAFSKACGYHLDVLQAKTVREAWEMLAQGKADLFIGSGYEPPADLKQACSAGPAYGTHLPVILRGENAKQLFIKGAVGTRWKQFDSNPFLMRADKTLEKRIRTEAPWLEKGAITRVNTRSSLELILDSVQGGQASYALVDSGKLRLWRPFFPELRTERTLSEPIAYRWYWRTQRRDLAVTLNYFWKAPSTRDRLQILKEKYYGFLPEKSDGAVVAHFLETLAHEMPKYRSKIIHEARRCGIDPLLYVALIYQESQFDPKAVSNTGARGLLQFTSAAASYFGLNNPMNSSDSIRAGADYLKMLWKSLDGFGLSHWNRWFFALASYNQGRGHLSDAMSLAVKLGRSAGTWADLKFVYPKLQKQQYAAQVRYGSCRGQEAVQFVDNIRYYYYILRGLISLSRPEAEHLGPLVGRRLLALGSVF